MVRDRRLAGAAGRGGPAVPLSEVLPVAVRSDAEIALELGRVVAVEAALAAYKAELVMGLAGHRPDALDPAPGQPGCGR